MIADVGTIEDVRFEEFLDSDEKHFVIDVMFMGEEDIYPCLWMPGVGIQRYPQVGDTVAVIHVSKRWGIAIASSDYAGQDTNSGEIVIYSRNADRVPLAKIKLFNNGDVISRSSDADGVSQAGSELKADGSAALYASDGSGNEAGRVQLKPDGTVEILGNTKRLTLYGELDTQLQGLVGTAIPPTGINGELAKIATAINGIAPGSYSPSILSLDISTAEAQNVKTDG